ncbi:MAG: cupin domain-containing protein [Candidatus Hodarchaeales archaeon]|jgi:quercetin dioxygenase-like cupin family protein
MKEEFPEIISSLPEADIPIPGVQGWIAQGKEFQIIFFDVETTEEVPPHSHGEQYGIIIEGEVSLTIGGETRRYSKGDTFYVPEGVVHHAVFHSRFRSVEFFVDTQRYKVKKE